MFIPLKMVLIGIDPYPIFGPKSRSEHETKTMPLPLWLNHNWLILWFPKSLESTKNGHIVPRQVEDVMTRGKEMD
jgi:hypothetical protein